MDLIEERVLAKVFQNISVALQSWLDALTVVEERNQIIMSLEERIERTLIQVRQEGEIPIYAFESLKQIGALWLNLVELMYLRERDLNVIADVIKNTTSHMT